MCERVDSDSIDAIIDPKTLDAIQLQTDFHDVTLDSAIYRHFLKVTCLVENRLFCSALLHCVCACVGACVGVCVGAWLGGCVGGCMGGCMGGCRGAWVPGCLGGCMGAWVCGCMGAWVCGWVLPSKLKICSKQLFHPNCGVLCPWLAWGHKGTMHLVPLGVWVVG